MPSLAAGEWAVLVGSLFLVGFSKTGVSGAGTIAIALFALVLPTKSSTGVLLPLLLLGDVVAVASYRGHADWPRLLRLFPWVAAGVVAGAVVVRWVDDAQMRRLIGAILLIILAVHFWNRRRGPDASLAGHRAVAALAGVFSGFATMTANAAGPIMALYLLAAGLPVLGFLGTSAWFFLTINVFKLPFSIALGLITPAGLAFAAVTAPAVLAGAAAGRVAVAHINRTWFERVTLALTFLAALRLLF
ncbi:sulfite exporter TauE/SafE family protein [Sphaerisporangium sp. TRM90804]|uniref:sulfite exporter TauE/SafE family protein n=1 Tax=Sphaerisporangium sp. TRM90804 TaxID=3031113 RepID=UPI00244820BD|nr:sulfite exporter TauE/SafE family protein [Sphaerisporangium sp. TRM90804]MDH2424998.1 sulfite exporter TauE/SafE family protein [Sphaerisporangium sp. TRM90804]